MTQKEIDLAETCDANIMAQVFEPINLDGFTDRAELLKLAQTFSRLACYAEDTARAMELRQLGDIECAISFEKCAQRQYGLLPQWAKW